MTPIEQLGNLCGDRYMYTLPPTINHEQAARELLEQLRVEKLARIAVRSTDEPNIR